VGCRCRIVSRRIDDQASSVTRRGCPLARATVGQMSWEDTTSELPDFLLFDIRMRSTSLQRWSRPPGTGAIRRLLDNSPADVCRAGEFRISCRVGTASWLMAGFSLTTKPAEMLPFYPGVNRGLPTGWVLCSRHGPLCHCATAMHHRIDGRATSLCGLKHAPKIRNDSR
jgi:hypothetical protein